MTQRKNKRRKSPQGRDWLANNYFLLGSAGFVLAVTLLASNFLSRDSQDRARVLRISGPVSVERSGGKIVPVAGMVLNNRDKLVTGEGAFVEVAYDEGLKDVVRVGSRSQVVLESAVIEKQTNIFLSQGDIILKLEKLEKGSTFKVRTPTAVAGVRGTSFGVSLRGKEAVILDFDSRIFVKGINRDFIENTDELLLNEGWKVRLAQFERPSRVERITDAERTVWLAWINEIDGLSPKAAGAASGFAAAPSAVYSAAWNLGIDGIWRQIAGLLAGLMTKTGTSVSVLAFFLYIALAVNMGKVFA
ncbi:MAG: FecR domain-containing protein [Candidatus Omnitrophica bacterium]|nr:FecR domain-containing protein [Candidatus Omnitrophota bacterium]